MLLRYPGNLIAIGFGAATIAGVTTYILTRRRPTPAEIERVRRDHLAEIGRITDGSITETHWLRDSPAESPASSTPCILIYCYRIAGVTYECAQDVTTLRDHVRHVRIDLPVQVRFDSRNPGNSIVVAESWSGLRLDAAAPHLDNPLEGPIDSQSRNQTIPAPDTPETRPTDPTP